MTVRMFGKCELVVHNGNEGTQVCMTDRKLRSMHMRQTVLAHHVEYRLVSLIQCVAQCHVTR